LIQSALVIFDLFDISEERDGLLCDVTVESIQRWTLDVGEQLQELRLEVRLLYLHICTSWLTHRSQQSVFSIPRLSRRSSASWRPLGVNWLPYYLPEL
jgi:hypothetical protein